jgi:hypothetical protein
VRGAARPLFGAQDRANVIFVPISKVKPLIGVRSHDVPPIGDAQIKLKPGVHTENFSPGPKTDYVAEIVMKPYDSVSNISARYRRSTP